MYRLIETVLVVLIAISAVSVGFWVYSSDRKKKFGQWFLLASVFLLGWVSFAYLGARATDLSRATVLYRLNIGIVLLFIFAFYKFVDFYSARKSKLWEKFLFVAWAILSFLSFFTDLVVKETAIKDWGAEIVFGELGFVYKIFAFSVTLIILKHLLAHYFSVPREEKLKIQYFFLGIFLFAFGNIIFNVVLPIVLGTVRYQHFGDFSAMFLLGFTAYAIIKRELFGIRVALTSVLIVLIAMLLFVDLLFFTDLQRIRIAKSGILILFFVFGRALIKSIVNEIRQRKKLERMTKDLEKANIELKKLDQAKSEFLSIASHQLRTPLAAMRGYLSMLIQGDFGPISPKVKEITSEVHQASLRLLKLSNDLLNVSRIESGKSTLQYSKTSIRDLISSVAEEMKIEAQKKGLYLRVSVSEDLPSAEIDAEKIRQVVLNVVDNSLKYTQSGGVVVSAEVSNGDKILIKVRDTGAGLSKSDMAKLFQSFSRGQAGSTLYSAGTGLGLYVARKLIDQHRGRIWVKSPGRHQGSTFLIEFPRFKDSA